MTAQDLEARDLLIDLFSALRRCERPGVPDSGVLHDLLFVVESLGGVRPGLIDRDARHPRPGERLSSAISRAVATLRHEGVLQYSGPENTLEIEKHYVREEPQRVILEAVLYAGQATGEPAFPLLPRYIWMADRLRLSPGDTSRETVDALANALLYPPPWATACADLYARLTNSIREERAAHAVLAPATPERIERLFWEHHGGAAYPPPPEP